MMAGVLPNEIVVFNVPVESWRGTTGERDPRGLDLGENCSAGLIIMSSTTMCTTPDDSCVLRTASCDTRCS